jgi:hypothetical protein
MCICVTLCASWLRLFFHCWKAHELSKMEHWAILVCFQDALRRESVEVLLEFVKVSLKPSSSHLAKLYSSHLIIIYIYRLFIGFSPHCGCWNNCVYLIVTLCPQFDQAYTVIRITSAQIDNNLPCSMPSISPFILKVCETPCPTNRDAARCRAASFGARETCPSHLQG